MFTLQTTRASRRRVRRRGFTLMELIIVIGILVLLMGLLIPILSMVNRQGQSTKTAATLSSIATGLEAYRSDFGDYPRFSPDDPNFPNPLNSAPDRGARLLARALMGPAPANDPRMDHDLSSGGPWTSTQDYLNACKSAFQDGHGDSANPFGQKESRQLVQRSNEAGAYYPGKLYSPYLDPERFELRIIRDLPEVDPAQSFDGNLALLAADSGFRYGVDAVILDPANRQPILFYPALAKSPDVGQQAARSSPTVPAFEAFPAQGDPVGLFIDGYRLDQKQQSLYNGFDNLGYIVPDDGRRFPGLAMNDPDPVTNLTLYSFRELLGDVNQDGRIDSGEKAATTAPYLLIAGGIDGFAAAESPSGSGNFVWLVASPIANFDIAHSK